MIFVKQNVANEHFRPVFSTAAATQIVFQQPAGIFSMRSTDIAGKFILEFPLIYLLTSSTEKLTVNQGNADA